MTEDIKRFRRCLPIYSARETLVREFRSNLCSVVVGETGSGKTTQIPQYLNEAGFTRRGAIAITQPRRVAAVSIATRVALESDVTLGQQVGYCVRFDDCSSSETKLRYMTDGMLLREAMLDPQLRRYSVVILDEAHERTIHTDVLFGVVKQAQQRRRNHGKRPLHIIVMSATLEAELFAAYFNNARILYIQGRQYPVQIYYTVQPQTDYLQSAITAAFQIHGEEEGEGDILLFLTGQEEIEAASEAMIRTKPLMPQQWKDLLICPLYASLPSHKQQRVFQTTPSGCRKVILSTNLAETSITIPGVKYVIDTGMVKARGYNPCVGLDLLLVQPVSKAQARQRAGRAGREREGFCYRLYTEESFNALTESTVPEIQRCNLNTVVLQLLVLGISDILGFDFMDPPSEESLVSALEQLYLLGAVERQDSTLKLTKMGKSMSSFPIDPLLSRSLLASEELKCGGEIVSIVAMLSADTVLYTPHGKDRETALAMRRKFLSDDGDHMMLLKIYRAYKAAKGNKAWCKENFIHSRNMQMVKEIRIQLKSVCSHNNVSLLTSHDSDTVRKCLLYGHFVNIAEHIGEGKYQTVCSRQVVYIHPSSCLFHCKPHPTLLMYSELVYTSKCYMRTVSIINPDWLLEVAPMYFKRRIQTTNL